jgi:hypothetical protein
MRPDTAFIDESRTDNATESHGTMIRNVDDSISQSEFPTGLERFKKRALRFATLFLGLHQNLWVDSQLKGAFFLGITRQRNDGQQNSLFP